MKPTLSPGELAKAIGVSESSLKRWVDEGLIQASRTSGGHRRIALAEAIRYIRESGIPVIRPDILGISDVSAASLTEAARQNPDKTLQEALLAGQAAQARGIVLSLYLAGRSTAKVWDHAIARAMQHIGTLWKQDASGIYIEHRATDICLQAISLLRAMLPAPQDSWPVAIGGAPSGDPYALPSLMAAATAGATRFRDINLGPDMPIDILAQAARHYQAKLVWLAVSAARPVETLHEETDRLAAELAGHGAQLVVGGPAVPEEFVLRHSNARVARTMAEFEAFAKGLATSTANP
jgi:MerR family transcriptional regulator, light-induced transcriptional regulator